MSVLQSVFERFLADPKRKTKNIMRGGVYTKEFLKFNRRYIKEGLETEYAEKDKVYNPKTKRFVNKLTKTGRVKQMYKPDKLVGSVIKQKSLGREFYFPADDEELNSNELLYTIIRDNPSLRGKYRIVIKRDGNVVHDSNYDIPNAISKWWNQLVRQSFQVSSGYMIWNHGSDDLGNEFTDISKPVNIIFTKETKLAQKVISQTFRQSVNNRCFFNPIENWINDKIETVESKSSKNKYEEMKNKIFGKQLKSGWKAGYIEEFPDGMPQDKIQEFCSYATVGVKIYQPFQSKPFIHVKPEKAEPRKTFTYVNTKLNHIDGVPLQASNKNCWETVYTDDINYEVASRKELVKFWKECNEKNIPVIYNKDVYGINMIKTMEEGYKLNNEYDDLVNRFHIDNDLYNCRLNVSAEPELFNFINKGTHFNGTIDFCEIDNETKDFTGIEHIDMTSAYLQYKLNEYYKGFALKITDFRPMDNIEHNGFYLITQINDDNVKEADRQLITDLGWFYEDNIYTQPELKMFQDLGYKFKVIYGAIAINNHDIDMLGYKAEERTLLDKIAIIGDDKKIPAYCKMVGSWASCRDTKSFFMNCDSKFARTFSQNNFNVYYNEGETRIETPKEATYSMVHLAAQITAFQRMIMLDQLRKLDQDKIMRVCCDGIYYKKHECEIIKPFRPKKDMTFRNKECEHYLSNVSKNQTEPLSLNWNTSKKVYKNNTYLIGAGGTGKTYTLGTDKGLINVLYIAPSWELATDAKKKFPHWECNVKERLFNKNHIARGIFRRYNNIIIDECSMWWKNEKRHVCENKRFDTRIFWVGDIDCQLPPFRPQQMWNKIKKQNKGQIPFEYKQQIDLPNPKMKKAEVIEFTKVYRFKEGDKLHEICEGMRELITLNPETMMKTLKEVFPNDIKFIDDEELKKVYKRKDTIIASQHCINDKYTEMFKDLKKYKVKEIGEIKGEKVFNGTILFDKPPKGIKNELRHGFTIHSFQGKTVKNGKLYIHSKLSSSKMIYTAMSRATSISQIVFIEG